MNKTVHKLNLLFQTSRHLTPQQVLYRLYYLLRKRCWRLTGKRASSPAICRLIGYHPLYVGLQDSTEPGRWERDFGECLRRGRGVAKQRFQFLNVESQYPDKVDWHDPAVSQLWRYHLHYFDYVEDLLLWAASGYDSLAWDGFCRLVDSWIDGNGKLAGDGWHPFTLSLRVVNWLHAFHFWKSRFDSDPHFSRRFVASIYGQASILASSLEYDVRGNHLLKNLRALIWCGVAFEGRQAEQWLDRAMAALEREVAEQLLGDGGHFERAPGYHAAVLKDCMEIGLWLRRNRPGKVYHWLDDALQRMLRYLVFILPPDGKLPLLKDTAWDVTPPPCDLLAAGALYLENPEFKLSDEFGAYPMLLFGRKGWETYRQWPLDVKEIQSGSLPESGYYVMRDRKAGDYLIFDGGKVCPEYLPAHAHADMFSYELTAQGRRVVVDTGVYEYSAGGWRDYFRSTRAHNTVEVEGQNQSEVWGSFRVAKRARPFQVLWKTGDGHVLVDAKHDGYLRLKVPAIHRRALLWVKGSFWLIVDVLLEAGGQRAEVRDRGSAVGEHGDEVRCRDEREVVRVSSYIHLHPSTRPEVVDSGRWRLDGLPRPLWVQAFGHQATGITEGRIDPFIQGWYSEQFGERRPNSVLSIEKEHSLPFLFGYAISSVDNLSIEFNMRGSEEGEITVKDERKIHRLIIERDSVRYVP